MEDFNYAILDEENLVIDIIIATEEVMTTYFSDKKYVICKDYTIIGMRYIQETDEFIDESYVDSMADTPAPEEVIPVVEI